MIPDKLKILGKIYSIKRDPNLLADNDHFGEANFRAATIALDCNMEDQVANTYLLHEILEVVNHDHYLELTQSQIQTIANSLHQILKDNELNFKE